MNAPEAEPVEFDEFFDPDDNNDDQIVTLTLRVGEMRYGIPVERITEIVRHQPITEVPAVPGHVVGIVNLRGVVTPVIDLRARFGLEPAEPGPRTCVVIVREEGSEAGLVVDVVEEVRSLPVDAAVRLSSDPTLPFVNSVVQVEDSGRIEDIFLLDVRAVLFRGFEHLIPVAA